jgi:hypothetical protein
LLGVAVGLGAETINMGGRVAAQGGELARPLAQSLIVELLDTGPCR